MAISQMVQPRDYYKLPKVPQDASNSPGKQSNIQHQNTTLTTSLRYFTVSTLDQQMPFNIVISLEAVFGSCWDKKQVPHKINLEQKMGVTVSNLDSKV